MKPVKCGNAQCDWWNGNECTYPGNLNINPFPESNADCDAFQPYYFEWE